MPGEGMTQETGARFIRPPAMIKVVGVGGGGCNAVRRMAAKQVAGVEFLAVNTDIKSLESVQGIMAIQIGEELTHGWGAGGKPEVGAESAEKGKESLRKFIRDADLIFVTAGMGGGTGTGAAPVVAKIAKESGALTVGVVTTPFSFEGKRRLEQAIAGVGELKKNVDNLVVIHNDQLLKMVAEDVPMREAFAMADEVVMQGILGVSSVINVPGEINVDLADVKALMSIPGTALMAVGNGSGAKAALDAASQAINNPLLELSIHGAKGVLFNIAGGKDLTIGQVNAAGEMIAKAADPEAIIFFGMTTDPTMEGKARITLIATGIPGTDEAIQESLKKFLARPQLHDTTAASSLSASRKKLW
ncbi:MAG: cell division protein FtsZ [Dehalococcoidia bacterium]|nr:cell division protein FtsZ [Dehalococcoidia bacterium]